MADITPIKLAEQVPSAALGVAASAGGDAVLWNADNLTLIFVNGGGAAITVTITATVTSSNVDNIGPVTIPNRTVSLAAGETKAVKMATAQAFLDANNKIPLTYSGVSGLKVIALRP